MANTPPPTAFRPSPYDAAFVPGILHPWFPSQLEPFMVQPAFVCKVTAFAVELETPSKISISPLLGLFHNDQE